MFLAGGVCLTALSMMNRDIVTAERSVKMAEQFGPFQPWFFYGVAAVEIVMMPALGRGIQNVYVGMNIKDWPNVDIMFPLCITQIIILAMLLLGAYKFQKLKHPATWLAVAVNLFIFLLEPLGRSENVQIFLKSILKG